MDEVQCNVAPRGEINPSFLSFKMSESLYFLFVWFKAHEEDFDIPAEWHFHGTAHGKGACDAIGANIKRFAARSSLQRSSKHHILTPQALFQWVKSNCKETKIFFSSKESYAIATEILKGQFDQAVTILGTLQYHAFISTQDRKLLMNNFSFSEKYVIFPKGQKKKPQKRPAKLPSKAKKIVKKHNSESDIHSKIMTADNCLSVWANFKKWTNFSCSVANITSNF